MHLAVTELLYAYRLADGCLDREILIHALQGYIHD